jgi:ABC-2 type transport system ATP-binding protein
MAKKCASTLVSFDYSRRNIMNENVIMVKDFQKSYGSTVAVAGISFEVQRGEIYGLLGPNGAGKTTTLECLEGIRRPDAGQLRIMEVDPSREPRKLNNLIGVQLQTSSLPPNMTVAEAMKFFSAYHGVTPRYDMLDRLGLKEKSKVQYQQLSTGLQRRLALALAVAHTPPVLILDEPTAGLDVESRNELHKLMQELKENGTSILLATHDMAEAEKMADRIAILLGGIIVVTGTPRELTATGSGFTKVSVRTERSALHNNGTIFPAVEKKLIKDDYAIFFSLDPAPTVTALLEFVNSHGDRLVDLRVERPTLEERFLEITQTGTSK